MFGAKLTDDLVDMMLIEFMYILGKQVLNLPLNRMRPFCIVN
jgi:hypothetical protein